MSHVGFRLSQLKFDWYQLKPNTLLLVKREYLVGLLNDCICKAGNLNRFCRATGLTFPSIYHFLKGNGDLISVRKLILVFDYLGLPYSLASAQILEVRHGKMASVISPRFPIDLNCEDMGTLLGHVVSDGSIYVDTQRNHLRTKYTNSDVELIDGFVESVQRVFGNVHYSSDPVRGSVTIRFGSELVGRVLMICGAMVGNKTKQNGVLPWLVETARDPVKIAYLRAAFSDEGTVGSTNGYPYVLLSRSCTVPASVPVSLLRQFDAQMRSSLFPTGHLNRCMSLRKAINSALLSGSYPKELRDVFEMPPNLLFQEAELLRALGIRANLSPAALSKNHSGSYSYSYTLAVQGKANVTKFYQTVGFSLVRKQEKLRILLENCRCI